jgi:hypothetical protein
MNRDTQRTTKPSARKDGLVIRELGEEVLVYDSKSRKYHCLNHTTALIWRNCDGRNTPAQISDHLGTRLECTVDERLVWLALRQLDSFDLLTSDIILPDALQGLSRRDLIRVAVPTMLAMPAIISIVAPRASAAASVISSADCNKRHPSDLPGGLGCGGAPCSGATGNCVQLSNGNSCHCV